MNFFVRTVGLVAAVAILASCGGGGAGGTSGPTQDACTSATFCATSSLTFSPTSATQARTAAVVWGNNSGITHNLTFDNASAAVAAGATGGDIVTGATRTTTFSVAGSYPFHCAIHPSMTGTITIQ